jgi:NAD(P)-dependent dehydrogenase (short-subunit alcohol dehydrogenase family)
VTVPFSSRFESRIALVTGGARGIGAAIARRLQAEGAIVHLLDRTYPEISPDEELHRHTGDVTHSADVEACIEAILQEHGRLDILVNNAGIVRDHVIWKMPEEDFDAVLEVNLKGPWLLCRAVAPVMRRQQYGRIVNIASRAWLGNFGQSNYAASKGGLVSLTRVLALELARYHVTVNAVAPGFIDTPLTRCLGAEIYQQLTDAQPGKQPGQPEDVAAAVAFLASDEARFITGQVLLVDGGKSIGAIMA